VCGVLPTKYRHNVVRKSPRRSVRYFHIRGNSKPNIKLLVIKLDHFMEARVIYCALVAFVSKGNANGVINTEGCLSCRN